MTVYSVYAVEKLSCLIPACTTDWIQIFPDKQTVKILYKDFKRLWPTSRKIANTLL